MAYEAMEWAQESKQDLVLLIIDFKKACNKMNWTFQKEAMHKVGFSKEPIVQIALFYKRIRTLTI